MGLFSRVSQYNKIIQDPSNGLSYLTRPWRYPLWQVGNRPEYFAYKAKNGVDGVCLIERIDLPDSRVVVACIQTAGNPGMSITNCVEALAIQVCERFNIPADKLVWLEHYDSDPDEWRLVTFESKPPAGPFINPCWVAVDSASWADLQSRPKACSKVWAEQFESKLEKLFDWPDANLSD